MTHKNPIKGKGKCSIGKCRVCGIEIRYKRAQICIRCSYKKGERERRERGYL